MGYKRVIGAETAPVGVTRFDRISMIGKNFGGNGADRDRTGDPLLAKQVLSQLSYRPEGLAR